MLSYLLVALGWSNASLQIFSFSSVGWFPVLVVLIRLVVKLTDPFHYNVVVRKSYFPLGISFFPAVYSAFVLDQWVIIVEHLLL